MGPPFAAHTLLNSAPVCVCPRVTLCVVGNHHVTAELIYRTGGLRRVDLGAINRMSNKAADHQFFNDVQSFKGRVAYGKESKVIRSAQPAKAYML